MHLSLHSQRPKLTQQMLWNWTVIDSCFLTRSWHVRSTGGFVASCIGVVVLVMTLELLRRTVKEYDRYLVRTHLARRAVATSATAAAFPVTSSSSASTLAAATAANNNKPVSGALVPAGAAMACEPCVVAPFRPSFYQQVVRAALHMLQFAVAYFVML